MNIKRFEAQKPELVHAVCHLLRDHGVICSDEDIAKVTIEVVNVGPAELEVIPKKPESDLSPKARGRWAKQYRFEKPVQLGEHEWDDLFLQFDGDEKILWHCRDLFRALKASGNRPVKVYEPSTNTSWNNAVSLFNRTMRKEPWPLGRLRYRKIRHLFITTSYNLAQMWTITRIKGS